MVLMPNHIVWAIIWVFCPKDRVSGQVLGTLEVQVASKEPSSKFWEPQHIAEVFVKGRLKPKALEDEVFGLVDVQGKMG